MTGSVNDVPALKTMGCGYRVLKNLLVGVLKGNTFSFEHFNIHRTC